MNKFQSSSLSQRALQVLHVAKELFLEHGYEKTSLEMVIKGAGGSRRTVYAEFGNKQQLFQAVVLQKVEELQLRLRQRTLEGPPEEVLNALGNEFLSVLMMPDSLAMFRLMIGNVARMPEVGREVYQAGPPVGIQPLAEYFREQKRLGIVNIDDPEESGHLLLSMFKGHMHLRGMIDPDYRPEPDAIPRHIAECVTVFLRGVMA